jgi:hypothetical protein
VRDSLRDSCSSAGARVQHWSGKEDGGIRQDGNNEDDNDNDDIVEGGDGFEGLRIPIFKHQKQTQKKTQQQMQMQQKQMQQKQHEKRGSAAVLLPSPFVHLGRRLSRVEAGELLRALKPKETRRRRVGGGFANEVLDPKSGRW